MSREPGWPTYADYATCPPWCQHQGNCPGAGDAPGTCANCGEEVPESEIVHWDERDPSKGWCADCWPPEPDPDEQLEQMKDDGSHWGATRA